jgi:pSer/pThr/pTyr-binding forkhead associated (FHA) protein
MLSLKVLSGKKVGAEWNISHFPVQIGRSTSVDFPVDEPGVWERHFEIDLHFPDGLFLKTQPNALVTVNGENIEQALLRSGDLIEIGALKIRFGLSAVQQRSLVFREFAMWIALTGLCLGQIALIYWLIR